MLTDLKINEEVGLCIRANTTQILERGFESVYEEQMWGKNEQERAELQLMLSTMYSVSLKLRENISNEQITVGREFWMVGTGLFSMFLRYEKTTPTLNRLLTGNYKNPQKMLEELNRQKIFDQNTDLWQMLGWLTEWKKIT